ncbi:MAG: hypothetical protein AAF721_14055 [Myxococcota bacterium]
MQMFQHGAAVAAAATVFSLAGAAQAVPGRAVDIDASYHHSCAVTDCGDLVCWGRNDYGQAVDRIITSGFFLEPPDRWTDVSTGFYHSCGVNENFEAYCWGNNGQGQLDLPLSDDVLQVTAGGYHTCEIYSATNEVFCSGYDGQGQASPPGEFFVDISAGAFHTCGVRPVGDVLCWGSDGAGQSFGHQPTPNWAMFPGEEFVDVEAGNYHTCALTNQDNVYCWGSNGSGQLHPEYDDGTWGEIRPNFWRYADNHHLLDVGTATSCTLTGTSLDCWGGPFVLGGSAAPPSNFAYDDVAIGASHGCAFDTSGDLMCWGSDSHGQATPDLVDGGWCPGTGPQIPPWPSFPWG